MNMTSKTFFITTKLLMIAAFVGLMFAAIPVSLISFNGDTSVQISTAIATDVGGPDLAPAGSGTKEEGLSWFSRWFLVPALSAIGAALVSFVSLFVIAASVIFDWFFQHTVTDFVGTLNTLHLTSGIETAWSAFRDMGNIIIIGMFVFIAITMILGNQEYGAKKLVAHVLIVAVLINFSLFFARFIIDASNLVSYQFYKSIQSISPATGGSSTSISDRTAIADQFMKRIGVQSMQQTYTTSSKIADEAGVAWAALAYALISCALLIVLAAVLLYGAFLMVSRAILLVFLMLISALAFASWLTPKLRNKEWGWGNWWTTLFEAAFFGPMLTIFLWAGLVILSQVSPITTPDGVAIQNATKGTGGGWDSIFLFAFVTGFLYISIKISHNASKGIAGFADASRGPALALVGGSRLASFVGKQSVGRLAALANASLTGRAQRMEEQGRTGAATRAYRLAQGFGAMARSDLNLMNIKAVRDRTTGDAGLTGKLTGETKLGGLMGTRERQAQRAVEQASRTTVSAQRQQEISTAAIQAERTRQAGDRQIAAGDTQAAEMNTDIAKQEQNRLTREIRDFERDRTRSRDAGDAAAVSAAETGIAARQTQLQAVEARIENARRDITQSRAEMENMEGDAIQAGRAAIAPLSAENVARRASLQRPSRLWGRMGDPQTDPVSRQAAQTAREEGRTQRLRDRLERLRNNAWGTPSQNP